MVAPMWLPLLLLLFCSPLCSKEIPPLGARNCPMRIGDDSVYSMQNCPRGTRCQLNYTIITDKPLPESRNQDVNNTHYPATSCVDKNVCNATGCWPYVYNIPDQELKRTLLCCCVYPDDCSEKFLVDTNKRYDYIYGTFKDTDGHFGRHYVRRIANDKGDLLRKAGILYEKGVEGVELFMIPLTHLQLETDTERYPLMNDRNPTRAFKGSLWRPAVASPRRPPALHCPRAITRRASIYLHGKLSAYFATNCTAARPNCRFTASVNGEMALGNTNGECVAQKECEMSGCYLPLDDQLGSVHCCCITGDCTNKIRAYLDKLSSDLHTFALATDSVEKPVKQADMKAHAHLIQSFVPFVDYSEKGSLRIDDVRIAINRFTGDAKTRRRGAPLNPRTGHPDTYPSSQLCPFKRTKYGRTKFARERNCTIKAPTCRLRVAVAQDYYDAEALRMKAELPNTVPKSTVDPFPEFADVDCVPAHHCQYDGCRVVLLNDGGKRIECCCADSLDCAATFKRQMHELVKNFTPAERMLALRDRWGDVRRVPKLGTNRIYVYHVIVVADDTRDMLEEEFGVVGPNGEEVIVEVIKDFVVQYERVSRKSGQPLNPISTPPWIGPPESRPSDARAP